jgi:polar amino acid transport system substrate-binding protein
MKQILSLMVLLLCSTITHANDISVVADPWCPYNCNPGERPGFMIEIAQQIFADAGHNLNYSLVPWRRAKLGVQNGTYDAIAGMAKDSDTLGLYVFPKEKVIASKICFYVAPESNWVFTGIESLDEVKLGVINGYGYWMKDSPIEKHFNEGIKTGKIDAVSGSQPIVQIVKMIFMGRISATLEDRFVMQYELNKMGKAGSLKEAGCQSKSDMIHIAFSKENKSSQDYAKILSDGIEHMKKTGEYQRILNRYLH